MHQQESRSSACRGHAVDGGLSGIDCCPDVCDGSRVLDLEPIHRVSIIGHMVESEILVEKLNKSF